MRKVDTSSTAAQSDAQPVIANRGKVGEPNVQYLPALNRYLLLTFSYREGLAPGRYMRNIHVGWDMKCRTLGSLDADTRKNGHTETLGCLTS